MFKVLFGLILAPFAAFGAVVTVAIAIGLIKGIFGKGKK